MGFGFGTRGHRAVETKIRWTDPMFGKKKRNESHTTVLFHCSFCNQSQRDVRQLIAGPDVYICNECVEICVDILAQKRKGQSEQKSEPNQLSQPWTRSTPGWCALCRLPVTFAQAVTVENRGLICPGCRGEIEAAFAREAVKP